MVCLRSGLRPSLRHTTRTVPQLSHEHWYKNWGGINDFAKTRFFGEAADPKNDRAKTSAWNDAIRLFKAELEKLQADLKALTVAYNEDQELYDEKSKHGANQKAYDPVAGKNIEAVDPGLKLLK